MAELFGIITAAIGTVDIVANRIQQISTQMKNASANPQEWIRVSNQYCIFKNELDSIEATLTSTSSISSQQKEQLVKYLSDINTRFKSMNEGLISMENRLSASNQSNQAPKKNSKISTLVRGAISTSKRSIKKLAMANTDADMITELQQNLDYVRVIMLQISNHMDACSQRADLTAVIAQTTITHDSFRAHLDFPVFPPKMHLDLNTVDENGNFVTHEGGLKQHILSIATSLCQKIHINAGSHIKNVCASVCARGMGGMGKSVALRYLCHDDDIREQFKDGIHFMTLGHAAGPEDVIRVISRCVKNAGFPATALKIRDSKSVIEAIEITGDLFREKRILIVVDDLWPTDDCKIGYLPQFQALISQAPTSMLLVSTRDDVIGKSCTKKVEFEELEPSGKTAKSILLEQVDEEAVKTWGKDPSSVSALNEILLICGGVKLILAIVGSGINEEVEDDEQKNLSKALIRYKKDIEVNRTDLIHSKSGDMYESNLRVVVCSSLDQCERNARPRNSRKVEMNYQELFESLCVMEKQRGMPLIAISRLWGIEIEIADRLLKHMKRMNLIRRCVRKVKGKDGEEIEVIWITMHDLVLDVSIYFGEEGKGIKVWLRQFLKSYIEVLNGGSIGLSVKFHDTDIECDNKIGEAGLSEGFGNPGRWNLENKEYAFWIDNVCRLLLRAELRIDLLRLLTTVEWTMIRRVYGGWPGLNLDYIQGIKAYENIPEDSKMSPQKTAGLRQVADELRTLQRVIGDYWGTFVLPFHDNTIGCFLHGSLGEEEECVNVIRYLESIQKNGPLPWVKPRRSIYYIDNRQVSREYVKFGPYLNSSSSTTGIAIFHEPNELAWFSFSEMCFTRKLKVLFSDHKNICVSPNGNLTLVVSNSGTMCIWSMQDGSRIAELLKVSSTNQDLSACSFDSSEHLVACSNQGRDLIVFKNQGRKWRRKNKLNHEKNVRSSLFSPSGQYLASTCSDRHVYIWDISTESPKVVQYLPCIYFPSCLAFNESGNLLAIGTWSNVLLWNWMDPEHARNPLRLVTQMVGSINFSTKYDFLVAGHHSSSDPISIWDVQTGAIICEYQQGHQSSLCHVQFSEDSRYVISLSEDCSIRKWRFTPTNTPRSSLAYKNCRLNCTSISPNGMWIASGFDDGSLQVYETNNKGNRKWRENYHQDSIVHIAFSNNSEQMVSTGLDGYVRVWEVATGNLKIEVREEERYMESAYCAAFNYNGSRLVSGYSDGVVCIWNIRSITDENQRRKPEERISFSGEIADVAFSQNERLVSCVNKEGWMYIWNTVTREMIGDSRNVRTSILFGLPESEVQEFHKTDDARFSLSFSEDNLMIIGTMRVQDNRGLGIWEASTSRQLGPSISYLDWNLRDAANRYEEWINKLLLDLNKNYDNTTEDSGKRIEREIKRNLQEIGMIMHSNRIENTPERTRCDRTSNQFQNTRLYFFDEAEGEVSTMNGSLKKLIDFPLKELVRVLVHAETNRIFWQGHEDTESVHILDIMEGNISTTVD